ncbi:MAG: helix-turn-helix transcriptional regulator [Gammaproteobacteria bacterium]|nr:helix-turn-helix transcriptional regulator [Gammaproteobacteria bacterium]
MNRLAEKIGLRLRAARRANNFRSARGFALHHNIPESTYSQHETGQRSLRPEIMLHYSELLNVSPNWLLTGEGGDNLNALQNPMQETESQQPSGVASNFKDYLTGITKQIPPIKDRVALIDMELFIEVLRAIAVTFANDKISVSYEELIDFCVEVYNSVVTTSPNKSNSKAIINLSISSLKKGINRRT